jgi:hypothetical protein
MQVYINKRYFHGQKQARAIWRQRLNTVLFTRRSRGVQRAPNQKQHERLPAGTVLGWIVLCGSHSHFDRLCSVEHRAASASPPTPPQGSPNNP